MKLFPPQSLFWRLIPKVLFISSPYFGENHGGERDFSLRDQTIFTSWTRHPIIDSMYDTEFLILLEQIAVIILSRILHTSVATDSHSSMQRCPVHCDITTQALPFHIFHIHNCAHKYIYGRYRIFVLVMDVFLVLQEFANPFHQNHSGIERTLQCFHQATMTVHQKYLLHKLVLLMLTEYGDDVLLAKTADVCLNSLFTWILITCFPII